MRLHILFGQRRETYEGEYAPEALVVWDDYTFNENPEGFDKDVKDAEIAFATEMVAMRVFLVEVDQDKLRRLLLSMPTLQGDIKEVT